MGVAVCDRPRDRRPIARICHAACARGDLRAMPVFLCRWPNGDCSIVLVRTRTAAVEKLDEVANAEGCPIIELSEAQVHFALGDDGQLVLEGLGEETEQESFEFCYPVLHEAMVAGEDVVTAVQIERDREQDDRSAPEVPATELGRRTKADLDAIALRLNTRPRKTLGYRTPAVTQRTPLHRPVESAVAGRGIRWWSTRLATTTSSGSTAVERPTPNSCTPSSGTRAPTTAA